MHEGIPQRVGALHADVETQRVGIQRGDEQDLVLGAHRRGDGEIEAAVPRREPSGEYFRAASTDEGFRQVERDGGGVGHRLVEDGDGAAGENREAEVRDGVGEPVAGLSGGGLNN